MTCFDTSTLDDSHFTCMPTLLRGVSVHLLYQTRCPVTFEEQSSDPTPFPHSAAVSLDFPSVTSVPVARFFDKCYATAALGRTVVFSWLISGPPVESPHTTGSITACTTRQPGRHGLTHVSWQILPRGGGVGMGGIPRRGRTGTPQVTSAYALWRLHATIGYGPEASQPVMGRSLYHISPAGIDSLFYDVNGRTRRCHFGLRIFHHPRCVKLVHLGVGCRCDPTTPSPRR